MKAYPCFAMFGVDDLGHILAPIGDAIELGHAMQSCPHVMILDGEGMTAIMVFTDREPNSISPDEKAQALYAANAVIDNPRAFNVRKVYSALGMEDDNA